jgi:hypothetical protein
MDLEILEVRVRPRLRRHLGDVELVVDVAVHVEALAGYGGDRLARQLQRDRLVAEEAPRCGLRHDGALVADHRLVPDEVRTDCLEHSPGHDDERDAGRAHPLDRRPAARMELRVFSDQGPVEIAGECVDPPRKLVGKPQPALLQISASTRRRTRRRPGSAAR